MLLSEHGGDPVPRFLPQAMPYLWSRASWGARPPVGNLSPLEVPRLITVHHTVSAAASPFREIRAIQDYHLGQGFDDIGYHFLVDRRSYVDGRDAYWGRQIQPDGSLSLGAHVRGHNEGNIGVAVLGNYDADKPSPAQLEALARLLAWLCFAWDLDPASIVPHSSLGGTACPGKYLTASLPWLQWQVTWWLHGLEGTAPGSPPPQAQARVVVRTASRVLQGTWHSRTAWIPVRALAEMLGRRVEWEESTRTVYVFLQRRPLLNLPAPPPPQVRVVVEQVVLSLDPPARVENNVAVAPLVPLAAALGQTVLEYEPARTAAVVTPPGAGPASRSC